MSPGESSDPAESIPAAAGPARRWVWHATLESQAAGQWSVLAVAETLAAVALYWWIAIRYDTHWHLLSSVFIAPLLLLRSPESMAAGVAWFLRDWFGFESYEKWNLVKTTSWVGGISLLTAIATFYFSRRLSNLWLPGLESWPIFGYAALVGALSVIFALAFATAFAFAFISLGNSAVFVAVFVAFAGAGAGAGAVAGAGAGVTALAVAFALVFLGAGAVGAVVAKFVAIVFAGIGLLLRSLTFRMVATLCHLLAGAKRLPENWYENNFLTDSFFPAELMPGMRTTASAADLTFEGLRNAWTTEKDKYEKVIYPLLGVIFFLPAFFYRLNIKATAWFWWPLVFLLKPVPIASAEGQQKQALCWPWTNPFQKLWIGVSVALVLLSLLVHYVDVEAFGALSKVAALPLAVKVSLAMDWGAIAPWHWSQWIMAGTGAGMLFLAGNARSQDLNGNWADFREKCWALHIRMIAGLQRVRFLATVSLLVMAAGALLLEYRAAWLPYVPVPEQWLNPLKVFYQLE